MIPVSREFLQRVLYACQHTSDPGGQLDGIEYEARAYLNDDLELDRIAALIAAGNAERDQ